MSDLSRVIRKLADEQIQRNAPLKAGRVTHIKVQAGEWRQITVSAGGDSRTMPILEHPGDPVTIGDWVAWLDWPSSPIALGRPVVD